ncbi:hypothetical protein KCU90_g2152, partial [Aureobasidium melanogenum]
MFRLVPFARMLLSTGPDPTPPVPPIAGGLPAVPSPGVGLGFAEPVPGFMVCPAPLAPPACKPPVPFNPFNPFAPLTPRFADWA